MDSNSDIKNEQKNVEQNITSETQTAQEPTAIHPKIDQDSAQETALKQLTKRVIIIAVIIVVSVFVSLGIYLLNQNNNAKSDNVSQLPSLKHEATLVKDGSKLSYISTQFSDKYIPSFDNIKAYAENGGDHWYLTPNNVIRTDKTNYQVITPEDTVPIESFTDILVVDDTIWIAGYGGIAKYNNSDGSKKTYLEDTIRPKLAYDPFGKTLYVLNLRDASGYDRGMMYTYNNNSDSFVRINSASAPDSAVDIAFTQNYIITTNNYHSEGSSNVSIFNRKTETWSGKTDWGLTRADGSSARVEIANFNESIVLFGLDPSLSGSCETPSQPDSTLFYQFNNGTFSEISDLNDLFKNYQASYYDSSRKTLFGKDSCGENNFAVDIGAKNNVITSTNKRNVDDNLITAYDEFKYSDKVSQLEKELNMPARIDLSKKANNDVFSVWRYGMLNNLTATSVVKTSNDVVSKPSVIASRDGYPYNIESIECGGGTYFINSKSMRGNNFVDTISKLNGNKFDVVYTTTNTQVYEGILTEMELTVNKYICSDNKIIILGAGSIGSFDPLTKKLTKTANTYTTGWTFMNSGQDAFVVFDYDSRTTGSTIDNMSIITIRDSVTKPQVTNIKLSGLDTITSKDETSVTYVAGFTDKYISVLRTIYAESADPITYSNTLYTFLINDGSLVKKSTLPIGSLSHMGLLSDTSFILQFSDGQTMVVDYLSHNAKNIKGLEKRWGDDFILSNDGYLWYTSDSGLVAYKL